MFFHKKSVAAAAVLVFFAGQMSFASPLTSALQRDASRFKNIQRAGTEEQQVQLSASAVVGLTRFNEKTNSSYTVRVNSATGTPRSMVDGNNFKVGKTDSNALSFIKSYKDLLGVDASQLKLALKRQSAAGYHFYFEQYYKNLKVENAYVKVNTDKDGNLIDYQSTYIKDLSLDITPSKSAKEASSVAAGDCSGSAESAELVIYSYTDGTAVLAWKVKVKGGSSEPGKWIYYVNASDGNLINRISTVMSAVQTFDASLNPVYPGFSGASKVTVPLSDLNVYYFSSGSTVAKAVTNVSGQTGDLTRSGRIFTSFDGPYFTVTDQRQLDTSSMTGYYVEKGLDTSSLEEPLSISWTSFNKPSGTPTPVYDACASGQYPLFASPKIDNLSVGYMDNYGIISDKAFLEITNPADSDKILGAFIGQTSTSFYGPLIPTASVSQTMNTAIVPSGASGTYSISTLAKLCAPYAFSSGYSQRSTHMVTDQANNTIAANVFYNLNAMRRFFKSLDSGGYINLDKHIPVMVNAYGLPYDSSSSGMLNSFYDTDQKLIMFGQGLRNPDESGSFYNFAMESPIVRHEYVHAVMDSIWPALYFDEGAAISEAVADYFALSSITDGSGNPYTSKIGAWVSISSSTGGEGIVRDLSGTDTFDASTWASNAIYGQHKNSLVLSQALWSLRTASASKAYADKLVWGSLMFFPNSLLEFMDAMVATAKAMSSTWGVDLSSNVEAAFDAHNIKYSSVVTLNGDVYEPNNGTGSAADLSLNTITKKQLSAMINPASDIDFYSVSLPAGNFEATLYLPQVENMSPARYYAFGMFLLDANLKTVVDIVSPSLSGGQSDIATPDQSVTLKYTVPALLSGNTGRYILCVFKTDQAYYPSTVTNTTGAYKLAFKFASGSNVGAVPTSVSNFANGVTMSLSVPYVTGDQVSGTLSSVAPELADWEPDKVESLYEVRALDENLTPISGADTLTGTYLTLDSTPTYDASNKIINATVKFGGSFADLGYNTIYLQVLGKLRTNVSGTSTDYRTQYGIVSLGISNPIRNSVTSGKQIYIKNAVFNPEDGTKAKITLAPSSSGKIKVQIFTVDGLLVKTLKDDDISASMPDVLEWDGTNQSGNTVASGLYLLRIDGAGIDKQVKKLVVVK